MAYEISADHEHITTEQLQKQKDKQLSEAEQQELMQKAGSCAFCKANFMKFWAHQGEK